MSVRASRVGMRDPLALVAQICVPFGLTAYLSLRGGGYELDVWSVVGLAAWWLIALAAISGSISVDRTGRAARICVGLLAAFAAWTALGALWTDSVEQTLDEAARVLTYLGILILALGAGTGASPRRLSGAIGWAIAAVALIALSSRFFPGLVDANETLEFLPAAGARLNFPLDYWNGLAALFAIGFPLLLGQAAAGARPWERASACAVLPAIGLASYLTLSRGGAIATAAALAALVALAPRRRALLAPAALGAAGSTILILLADARFDFGHGLETDLADSQGLEMLAATVIAGLACGLLLAHAERLSSWRPIGPLPPNVKRGVLIGTLTAALAAIVVAISSGWVGDRWQEFKDPTVTGGNVSAERLESASGNGRYQFWETSLDALAEEPLTGIGAGTWEFWWAENGTIGGFVRDAHGLFFQLAAETGLVGLALLAGFLAAVIAIGVARSRSGTIEQRERHAVLTAAASAFIASAAIDWTWQQPVLPVVFLLLAAGLLGSPTAEESRRRSARARISRQIAGTAVALAAAVFLATVVLSEARLGASRAAAGAGDLGAALKAAQAADWLRPYSASAALQQALVLELGGIDDEAAKQAAEATDREPVNWRNWLILSRIEERRGRAAAAAVAHERARELNPRSPLFVNPG